MSYQNISFRPASAEELRLAALRQLIFEEPVSRLARMKKTVQRQLARADREKIKELAIYELAELHGAIFTQIDASEISAPAFAQSLTFTLALVLEDFRLYSATAFTAFVAANARFLQNQSFHPGSRSEAIYQLASRLSQLLDLGPERARWLTTALLATMDWSRVVNLQKTDKNPADEVDPMAVTAQLLAKINEEFSASPLLSQVDTFGSLKLLDSQALLTVATKAASQIAGQLRPALVVLVEGQSELIVLPHFARLMGRSLASEGVIVIASGGAQQVARRYLTLKDVLNIPIVCVFDGDAEESSTLIEEALRASDGLFCLDAGELEDCYSYEQLLKILNLQLLQVGQTLSSQPFEIPREGPRKKALNKLFRSRGLGDFDKIEFAKSTVNLATSAEDVPREMVRVIDFVLGKCCPRQATAVD